MIYTPSMSTTSEPMPTVVTEDGFRLKIYLNDHTPAHVHVQKADGEARVRLVHVKVMSSEGFNERDLHRIVQIVETYQDTLLAAWDNYHES